MAAKYSLARVEWGRGNIATATDCGVPSATSAEAAVAAASAAGCLRRALAVDSRTGRDGGGDGGASFTWPAGLRNNHLVFSLVCNGSIME